MHCSASDATPVLTCDVVLPHMTERPALGAEQLRVRHLMKNYHYSAGETRCAPVETFTNWKAIYNLSLCMSYVSRSLFDFHLVTSGGVKLPEAHNLHGRNVSMSWDLTTDYLATSTWGHIEYPHLPASQRPGSAHDGRHILAPTVIRHLSQLWFPALLGHSLTLHPPLLAHSDVTKNVCVLAQEVARQVKGIFEVYEETADVFLRQIAARHFGGGVGHEGVAEAVEGATRVSRMTYKLDAVRGLDGSLFYQLDEPCLKWDSQSRKY
ncbi:hypothetical protein GGX14DRAFT_570040 [Mycena pura]|uniref:Uncharacterized protein n=1 Tax=Mycena pura TaxID=153505 RepID=A0AAD6V5M5_9AGAR|nr:hypothetical protein GGX14DRAFT_570040 [Mycena pura]